MSEDRDTINAPPPSERETLPENERPIAVDDPGITAVANLIDAHLGGFLERQEARDKEFRQLIVDTINEAMVNREQMRGLEVRLEELEQKVARHSRELEKGRQEDAH